MILVDSSAWIDFLRDTGSPAAEQLERLLSTDEAVAITGAIEMEILAGARDEVHLLNLRRLLARAMLIETVPSDFSDAAMIYRTCRREGRTVRRMIDCLIAAAGRRLDLPLLHSDSDFDTIARSGMVRVVERDELRGS